MTSTALALTTETGVAVPPGSKEFERTAVRMAQQYADAVTNIRHYLRKTKEETDRLNEAFQVPDSISRPFDVAVSYGGDHYIKLDSPDGMFGKMKRTAWSVLVDHLGLKVVMSIAKRNEFERQLESGDLPEIDERTIVGVLLGLAGQAQDFARDAAREVFDFLRPSHPYFGGQYKTNDAFRVGRRVILTYMVEPGYSSGKFRVSYHKDQHVLALDSVFHLLDGKGVLRDHRGPLFKAVSESTTGRGETEYFRFKAFKNGNLHLEFKRLDLVKQLNLLAAGEAVLGDDAE